MKLKEFLQYKYISYVDIVGSGDDPKITSLALGKFEFTQDTIEDFKNFSEDDDDFDMSTFQCSIIPQKIDIAVFVYNNEFYVNKTFNEVIWEDMVGSDFYKTYDKAKKAFMNDIQSLIKTPSADTLYRASMVGTFYLDEIALK